MKYNTQVVTLQLLVIKGEGPSRNWLKPHKTQLEKYTCYDLQSKLVRNGEAFRDGLGKLQGYQAKIIVERGYTKVLQG